MKQKNHLPMYGVGPIYVYVIILLTVAGIVASHYGWFEFAIIPVLRAPFAVFGSLLIILGVILWCSAVFKAKIDKGIIENKLVTTGVYSWVRNPIYSAFLFICTGALLWANNLFLLILPPIFWLFLTFLMRGTEEKWLLNLYGNQYKEYCKNVNRCIPWFPKK